MLFIHSFSHSGYFYSASSSPLLLRGVPDTARILCRSFTPKHHRLAQSPYVVARAGFEPTTLQMKGDESTNEPPCPTMCFEALLQNPHFSDACCHMEDRV